MHCIQSLLRKHQQTVVVATARQQLQALSLSALTHSPRAVGRPFFSLPALSLRPQPARQPALRCFGASAVPSLTVAARGLHSDAPSSGGKCTFLRTGRFSVASLTAAGAAAPPGSLRFTPFCIPHRNMSVRGKSGAAGEESSGDKTKQGDENEGKKTEENEGKTGEGEEKANGQKKKTNQRKQQKKNSFADHIRGLKDDYMKFPDIYNSANGVNFIIFTVFCLCSTGSNAEEKWWMEQWGLDNTFRPWNWLLHSFLTNNFLSMTYAMMLLHTLCHAMIPTLGSNGLLAYVVATAAISGAVMWLGNRLYYGDKQALEKQFGPWDVVHALFVMYYMQFGLSPVTVLNSFNSWLKYAVWVGEICILYFDWQPTFVGALVGFALCKGVPRFRVKPLV